MFANSLPQVAMEPTSTPQPKPGTYFLEFQRQLAASEHIATLATMLANVHFLYEGWGECAYPLGGELKRIYRNAACFAVRACSEIERAVANGRAERWALRAFPKLEEELLKATPDQRDALLRTFVRGAIDMHRFHLMHGVGAMAPAEVADILNGLDEEDDHADPRRI